MLYEVITVPAERFPAMQDIFKAGDYGYLSREEYFRQLAELSGVTPDEIRSLNARQYTRNERMMELVRRLKVDYKVGLLSNVSSELLERLFSVPERTQLFDIFVESWKVGAIKPAAEIYEAALESGGLRAEECLFIDDVMANVDGAKSVGMDAIQFLSYDQIVHELHQRGIDA